MKLLFLIFCLPFSFAHASKITLTGVQEKELTEKISSWWESRPGFIDSLMQGEVVSWAEAHGEKPTQELSAKVVGLHPRTCGKGLRKISRYEDYHQHMSFVKESKYNEATQQVRFILDHSVLPFPMILMFKLPRISGPGVTEFVFPNGIFAGLKGTIHVASVGNRCAYFMRAEWKGKHTGLPNVVVGTFAQTLIKMGLEHLIRISSL